jgi:hypothetical protein
MMPESELLKHVCPIESYEAEDCRDFVAELQRYLTEFNWAHPTGRMWVGQCIPGVVGIFLVELKPSEADVDRFIWVIVGDLPSAYLSSIYAKTPREALSGYIGEMSAWISAVEKNEPTDDLIPVNAPPTIQSASSLKTRLEFLIREVLPLLQT